MARSGKRNSNPSLRPVIRAELSDKNRTLRWILIIGFSCIALISLIIGLRAVLVTEPGWEMVDCATTEVNTSADFVFSYCFGQTEEDASAEKKRLTLLYSDLSVNAHRIFTQELQKVNNAIEQPVTVDPALYEALELVQKYGNRHLYLAPVYAQYSPIFLSSTEQEAAEYDPHQNREVHEYAAELASFCKDPAMIDLVLLGDNQVRLQLSDTYAAYAEENEITEFVDFGWMTNAFVADYLADELTKAGFTNGYLSSFDGFTRNLDNRGEQFSLNLFDRQVNSIYMPATMHYDKPIAIVFLRDFPMSERDRFHYYAFSDGSIVTTFVNPANGESQCAVSSLTGYSYEKSCAEILMQLAPLFTELSLEDAALDTLIADGIHSLWFDGKILFCNDPDLPITVIEEDLGYSVQYTK